MRSWEKEVRKGCKATREEEAAVLTHTCEQVVESTEATPHKLDKVEPWPREGEVVVQAHTYERVEESTELTQLKLDTEATREVERNKAEKDENFRQAQVAQIKAHSNKGEVMGLFEGDEHTTHRTQGKEDAQVQGHSFDTNEEPEELIGGRRRAREKARKRNIRHTAVEGGMYKDKGTGRHGRIKAEGAGRGDMYKDEGTGHSDMYKDGGAGCQRRNKAKAAGLSRMYEDEGAGHDKTKIKQTDILQAETEGVRNYEKQTDFFQVKTEGAMNDKDEGAGRHKRNKAEGVRRRDMYEDKGAGQDMEEDRSKGGDNHIRQVWAVHGQGSGGQEPPEGEGRGRLLGHQGHVRDHPDHP
jgi:hypothetical protein